MRLAGRLPYYKSSAIETDRYLLACCRYVELNPVRAGMVSDPIEYPWSSYRAKIGFEKSEWLDQDPCYLELGETPAVRNTKYRHWVRGGIREPELVLIRKATQRGQLIGSDDFRDEVEQRFGRRIELRGRGRPKHLADRKK